MGKLVRALRQWANVEAPKENFLASSLRGIVGYVISKPSPQGAALLAYDELTKAFGSADKSKKPTEFDYDGNESNGIYRMLQTS